MALCELFSPAKWGAVEAELGKRNGIDEGREILPVRLISLSEAFLVHREQ